jgi:hypothetical protein
LETADDARLAFLAICKTCSLMSMRNPLSLYTVCLFLLQELVGQPTPGVVFQQQLDYDGDLMKKEKQR